MKFKLRSTPTTERQLGNFIMLTFPAFFPRWSQQQSKYQITNFKCDKLKANFEALPAALKALCRSIRDSPSARVTWRKRLKTYFAVLSRKLIRRVTFIGGSSIKFTFSHLNLFLFRASSFVAFYCFVFAAGRTEKLETWGLCWGTKWKSGKRRLFLWAIFKLPQRQALF